MKIVDKNTFSEIEKCNCGKDVFRYHNTSRNVYVAKCSNYTHDYNRVLKNWNDCKKKPCDFHYVYHGERPVHIEKIKEIVTKKCMEVSLEEKLRLLFSFLFVSNHSSTLDEINIIVRNQLKREPRKTFYFPSTTLIMRISHLESFEDYRDRIFSEKIIDLSHINEQKENFKPITCLPPDMEKWLSDMKPSTPPQKVKNQKIKKHIPKPIIQETSQFIVVSDDSDSDNNGFGSESDHDESSDSEESEKSEISEVLEEEDFYEEEFVDDGDDYDYD